MTPPGVSSPKAGRPGLALMLTTLKTPADVDVCLNAGFTFFTIDPGEYVDASAETAA